MKVELRANGRLRAELQAETPIEQVFLREMLARAAMGQPVSLDAGGEDRSIVSV